MRVNQSVMEVVGALLEGGQTDAAKAVINACSKTSRRPILKPTKQPVTAAQKDALIQRDIEKLKAYQTKDGKPIFKSVVSERSDGDSYIIKAITLNDVAKQKVREVVNPSTVKCSNGQFLQLA